MCGIKFFGNVLVKKKIKWCQKDFEAEGKNLCHLTWIYSEPFTSCVVFFPSGAVLSVSFYCQRLSVASIASKDFPTFWPQILVFGKHMPVPESSTKEKRRLPIKMCFDFKNVSLNFIFTTHQNIFIRPCLLTHRPLVSHFWMFYSAPKVERNVARENGKWWKVAVSDKDQHISFFARLTEK